MKIEVDTHTHTIASGHAYNTIQEMAVKAREKGLSMLGITDHTSTMPGAPNDFYFLNLKVVKREMSGIRLLMGAEVNIINQKGEIDLEERLVKHMDLVIASLHTPCIAYGTLEENTNAVIGAMKNPYVHIIGHPDDGRYPIDYERVVKAAKEHDVLLELNNNSLNPEGFRLNTKENDMKLLKLCKDLNVKIAIGSDAHVAEDIGTLNFAEEVIKEVEFPEELIINLSANDLIAFLNKKKENAGVKPLYFKTSSC